MRLAWLVLRGTKASLASRYTIGTTIKLSACSRSYSTPNHRFTDKHEWVVRDSKDSNQATVGISNYAQEALGEVVFAQLPAPGTRLSAGDECGALESVKAASELYSPISGVVTEKNAEVESQPALINTSCYDKGWLFKVTLSDSAEIDGLMNQEAYDEFVKKDAH